MFLVPNIDQIVTLHNEDKHLLQFSLKGKLHDIETIKKNLLTTGILQLRNEMMAQMFYRERHLPCMPCMG
jgi:hypothetical protein